MPRCAECGNNVFGNASDHTLTCSHRRMANKRMLVDLPDDADYSQKEGARKRPRSSRIQQRAQTEMNSLLSAAYGHNRPTLIVGDITPSLYRPLSQGNDGRYYTSTQARREIERTIASTARTYGREDQLPDMAREMLRRSRNSGRSVEHLSSRNANTGYRIGQDVTYTGVTGADHSGTRTPSDTPRPRSPAPSSTGEELPVPNLRYEQTHQSAYSFTGLPGSTVHAPTQANQVADTNLERFVSRTPGGFIVREDTYERSALTAYRPTGGGAYESLSTSYMRRLPAPESSSSSSPSVSSPKPEDPK